MLPPGNPSKETVIQSSSNCVGMDFNSEHAHWGLLGLRCCTWILFFYFFISQSIALSGLGLNWEDLNCLECFPLRIISLTVEHWIPDWSLELMLMYFPLGIVLTLSWILHTSKLPAAHLLMISSSVADDWQQLPGNYLLKSYVHIKGVLCIAHIAFFIALFCEINKGNAHVIA